MNRMRILVCASAHAQVARLIDLGWSFGRWGDAHIDAYVVPGGGSEALRARVGFVRPSDILLAECPADARQLQALAGWLVRVGLRAVLLPPRQGPYEGLFAGWRADPAAAPGSNSEAALLAIVVEQHVRWRGTAPRGHLGDPIATRAVTAVFNAEQPVWPRPRMVCSGDMRRLHMRTVASAAGLEAQYEEMACPGVGWVIVPQRPAWRLADALDGGDILLRPAQSQAVRGPSAARTALIMQVASSGQSRCMLPAGGLWRDDGLQCWLQADTLLDPCLHRSWESLRELLAMPRLCDELLATSDPSALRSLLLLDDAGLASANG